MVFFFSSLALSDEPGLHGAFGDRELSGGRKEEQGTTVKEGALVDGAGSAILEIPTAINTFKLLRDVVCILFIIIFLSLVTPEIVLMLLTF